MAARRRLEEMEASMPDELRHLTTLTRRELDSPPPAAPARRTPSPNKRETARSSSMSDRVAERMFAELDSDGSDRAAGSVRRHGVKLLGAVPRVAAQPELHIRAPPRVAIVVDEAALVARALRVQRELGRLAEVAHLRRVGKRARAAHRTDGEAILSEVLEGTDRGRT